MTGMFSTNIWEQLIISGAPRGVGDLRSRYRDGGESASFPGSKVCVIACFILSPHCRSRSHQFLSEKVSCGMIAIMLLHLNNHSPSVTRTCNNAANTSGTLKKVRREAKSTIFGLVHNWKLQKIYWSAWKVWSVNIITVSSKVSWRAGKLEL